MNVNKILGLSLFTLAVMSCKTEEKKPVETIEAANNVVVTLNVTAAKDDIFQVYYMLDAANPSYDESNSVRVEIKGSESPQNVVFSLPNDIIPAALRVDFGSNKEQKEVSINGFTMEHIGKKFEIKGADFFNYFRPEEKFVKIDRAASKVIPIVGDNGYVDPMVFSEEKLNQEIAKLAQ